MINNKTSAEYLIGSFASKGSQNSLTTDNTSLKAEVGGRVFATSNILSGKYRGVIFENSFELSLDDDKLFEMYRFKPKLLSMRLYGTTDLWHMILWLNNMTSASQFSRRKIIVFNPDSMDVLNRIVEKERLPLLRNRENPDRPIVDEVIFRR